MGMAASQARYLGLTARKTNVEYEGQQVNQARTALANQSADTFNELLSLEVPTAPSTQDYTTLQYSYEDGLLGETITNMEPLADDPDGYNYLITHHHFADVYTGIENIKRNPQVYYEPEPTAETLAAGSVTLNNNVYKVGNATCHQYDENNEDHKAVYDSLSANYPALAGIPANELYVYQDGEKALHFISKADLDANIDGTANGSDYSLAMGSSVMLGNIELGIYDPTDKEQVEAYNQILEDWPESKFASSTSTIYTWEASGQRYFACAEDLETTFNSAIDKSLPTENQNGLKYYCAQNISTKIETTDRALVDLSEEGRPESVRLEDSSVVRPLKTETITDQAAYEDAMNQYNYNQQVYEKKLADINAKTKKIQEQDRTLELRLRQLDTEQEALQTEMEAVKKVIEKNIESTFKTFQ